ncbi:hypothetical protein A7A76_12925 [Lysobacter enzymogenes]|uniref:hypothetical protein n=1 Tax=Lysobacter enzymogenes TaxID=69 RepID=UPI0019D163DC|nr:hypothetical protein [Lysobacter enzymogenes]MBN7135643.1 hypothetical protein [Lysobacter enzymogenes]
MSTGAQLKVVLQDAQGFYFSGDKAAKKESDTTVRWLNTVLKDESCYRDLCGGKGKLVVGFNFPPKDVAPERAKEIMSQAYERIGREVDALNPDKRMAMAASLMRGTTTEGKLDRDRVEEKLYAGYARPHDPEQDAKTLLASPMLAGHPARAADGFDKLGSVGKLEAISRSNLQEMRDEIAKYKELHAANGMSDTFGKKIDAFVADVGERYAQGIASHASNRPIAGHILATSDREQIQEFAQALTNNKSQPQSVSHTSEYNTRYLKSHDFAFFNVYPATNPEMQKQMLSATRYLCEKPEIAGSPIAKDAQSFSFNLPGLVNQTQDGAQRLTLLTLRDPVRPTHGGSEAEVKARMEGKEGLASYSGGTPAMGTATRKFGTETDSYDSARRVFVKGDSLEALKANVELGLYKAAYGLSKGEKSVDPTQNKDYKLYGMLNEATAPGEGAAKDRATMQLVKLFQYPQLMVSGPVSVQGVEPFRPGQTQATQLAAQTTLPSVSATQLNQANQANQSNEQHKVQVRTM